MVEEIRNLTALVDVVSKKVELKVKEGDKELLKELLWNVPTTILVDVATRDSK